MFQQEQASRLRFECFELDLQSRELRKEGRPIKLQDQPVRLLALLASRPGELVTRAEIQKALWGEDQFVEFEHGINTAMRKIREALGDDLGKPRFIETLPRKGYRFIASVNAIATPGTDPRPPSAPSFGAEEPGGEGDGAAPHTVERPHVAAADELPEVGFALPRKAARALFLTTQVGYLAIYCAVLYQVEALEVILSRILGGYTGLALPLLIIAAMCGIALRLYLLSAVGLDHPQAGAKFRRLFPLLFVFDTFWAASPLLVVPEFGYGLALACVAALVYLPFSQRTLMESVDRGGKAADSGLSGD